MSDTVSFAELDGQHVQLLPARTVLSMFSQEGGLGLDKIFKNPTSFLDFLHSIFKPEGGNEGADAPGADGKSQS